MGSVSIFTALCERNPLVTVTFASQRPVMQSFAVFSVFSLIKLLNIQLSCQWFEISWHSCDFIKRFHMSLNCKNHNSCNCNKYICFWILPTHHPQAMGYALWISGTKLITSKLWYVYCECLGQNWFLASYDMHIVNIWDKSDNGHAMGCLM